MELAGAPRRDPYNWNTLRQRILNHFESGIVYPDARSVDVLRLITSQIIFGRS